MTMAQLTFVITEWLIIATLVTVGVTIILKFLGFESVIERMYKVALVFNIAAVISLGFYIIVSLI
jgi:hypothetical protein